MKSLFAVIALLGATQVKADGFVCLNHKGDLKIQVYDHVLPTEGTRTAAIMIASNPLLQNGNKTIAKFTDGNGTLDSAALFYVADVDLRFTDSSRKGELIGGTKLGELDKIQLQVGFSYSNPLANGDETFGTLTLVKRNGEELEQVMTCERYLKN